MQIFVDPKLNLKKNQFFANDGVKYTYDHDSIHRVMAIEEVPAYTNFQIDEVKVSKDLFMDLPYVIKLNAVIEESMVLAIERSLVPFPGAKSPKEAYAIALQKVCTSITSGWFREFAWENYYNALAAVDETYFEKFKNGLNNGKILLYKGV